MSASNDHASHGKGTVVTCNDPLSGSNMPSAMGEVGGVVCLLILASLPPALPCTLRAGRSMGGGGLQRWLLHGGATTTRRPKVLSVDATTHR